MPDKFYITTPIYYPNGEPHLGSIYTTMICDTLSRYHRLRGDDTFFLTGTDEHGTKMAKAAAAEGVEPGELADRYAAIFRDVWRELDITHDDFIRTTEPRHKTQVTRIVERLVASGDIYLGSYGGWYDEGQEEFITETAAKASDYKSAISGRPLSRYTEESYFFRLSKYAPQVLSHIEAHPEFIRPESRRNEVISKLRSGIDDLSISRASLKWGIPLPNDPRHVIYVWIDALSNYITALGYASDEDALFRKFWPADVHVIGKDILWFHTVYWPAMLLALGLALPKTVAAHGWWVTKSGAKGGKSTGGITTLPEIRVLRERYGLDAFRFYLLRAAPFGSDLEWNEAELDKSFNELANVVGNCLNRTIKMIGQYRQGTVPAVGDVEEIDQPLVAQTEKLSPALSDAYGRLALQECAMLPVELARATNGYIDTTAPFKLRKELDKAKRLDTVLNRSAQAIKNALVGLLPVLPEKATTGLRQLGIEPGTRTLDELLGTPLPPGHRLSEGVPLFPKVQTKE
ncbi:MAG TPA: methionine--tRNA ligase [Tepidisphaeraceae bacterium]|nr:methionine--tRNA ligase [Tepidisphaeraceae bacterium]